MRSLQGDPTSPFWRRSALGFLWKDWCSSWNSITLATSCKELIHWKRLWCWEGLGAGGEGDDRMRWLDGNTDSMDVSLGELRELVMTGRPGVLRFMGLQRARHDWATELNWTVVNNKVRTRQLIWLHQLWPRLASNRCHPISMEHHMGGFECPFYFYILSLNHHNNSMK